ncbi:sugar phosphate nucleotidyltransferase [Butyrivibrio sp. NC3005]|uniref:sugar phosphate nucleotidyltransferase n=1 Tax=Butyrivibrio sp. NC3005 TaxID=1280685 RepID=UPI00047BB8AE|nr:sugar phosphate nucleotidyltransferase [Butyrivibrio sp. NC3005]
MNIILLSGGSGKRLWPLSNDIRSKQFIKFFKNSEGSHESMLQRMYSGLKNIDNNCNITIATSKSQVSTIHNQISGDYALSVESARKNTFPAIVLAVNYLHEKKHVGEDESVIVCPIDSYVEDSYFKAIKDLYEHVKKSDSDISLMGVMPTYPSEKYGYIIPKDTSTFSKITGFIEKPDKALAQKFIKQGAIWNCGIFAFKLGYLIKKSHEIIDYQGYDDLLENYSALKSISFDNAVLEIEKSIDVMKYDGTWKDLGTWNTLTEEMDDNILGKGLIADSCRNVHLVNSLDVPILCMGLKNVVVSAAPEGILVSDKKESSYLKDYIGSFDSTIMFSEKSWGTYCVLDKEQASMALRVTVNEGCHMSYHSHAKRDESWNIISGTGIVVIDGEEKQVKAGDVVVIRAGYKHTIKAITEMKLIEVQFGKNIDVKDKVKYDLANNSENCSRYDDAI